MQWRMRYKYYMCVAFHSSTILPCLLSRDSYVAFSYLLYLGTFHVRTDRAQGQQVCRDMTELLVSGHLMHSCCLDSEHVFWVNWLFLLVLLWMSCFGLSLPSFLSMFVFFFFFNKFGRFLYMSRILALFYTYNRCKCFPIYRFSFTLFLVFFHTRCYIFMYSIISDFDFFWPLRNFFASAGLLIQFTCVVVSTVLQFYFF